MIQPLWQCAIRWFLTLGLILGVYSEAGPFTAVSIALIFLTLELLATRLRVDMGHKAKRPRRASKLG